MTITADEIVKELREYTYWCGSSNNASRDIHPGICDMAADRIESLQAQLATAQERERAAVALIRPDCSYCKNCGTDICPGGKCQFQGYEYFEWRGMPGRAE
jgi:hypothetical protein